MDRFSVGIADSQDKPPYRQRDEWDGDGTIYLTEADKQRRARFGLDEEEEESQ